MTHANELRAQELRVGNYIGTIYPKFKIQIIEEIKKYVVYTENIKGLSYSSITPIFLTKEVLSKINGIKISFTSDPQEPNASKLYKLGIINLYQPDEDIEHFIICYEDRTIKIRYLHVLQNLYLELNKKELEIKL